MQTYLNFLVARIKRSKKKIIATSYIVEKRFKDVSEIKLNFFTTTIAQFAVSQTIN